MSVIVQVGNIQTDRPNGVHAATRRLSSHLVSDGHEVEVWHFTRSAPSVTERLVDGIPVLDLPVRGLPGRLGGYVQVATPETLRVLRRRAEAARVLHLHSVFQPDHVWSARLGVPVVVAPHGGYDPRTMRGATGMGKRIAIRLHERPMLASAAQVQVLSPAEAAQVRAVAPTAGTRELPFPQDFSGGPARYRAGGPVVFAGRLDIDHKGLDLLLDAAASCAPAVARHGLVLVGPPVGGAVARLTRQARRLGIEDWVDIRPPATGPELRDLLAHASAFVHTSRREGLPTAVLEAMHAARPVLVTEETNLGPLVREAGAGIVSPAAAPAIAEALAALMGAPGFRRADMGRRGHEAVVRTFGWSRLGAEYEAMYAQAAAA